MARNKALIIFDWDDTLFPTFWLFSNGVKLDNILDIRKYALYFQELDSTLSKLLKMSITIGKVVIITNANIEWIMSSKKILPETSKIIDAYIQIISARDMYHQVYDMNEWKRRAFKNNIYNYVQWSNQIISIGDAEYEYEALISLKQYTNPKTCLKTIKLVKSPSFEVLIDQLDVITKSLYDIYKQPTHMDLKILTMAN